MHTNIGAMFCQKFAVLLLCITQTLCQPVGKYTYYILDNLFFDTLRHVSEIIFLLLVPDSRIGVQNSFVSFSVDLNWRKSKQPGGTFKINKYDENFSQVMYEIYENNPRLRNVAATIISHREKEQILTINSSTENNTLWEITIKSGK